MARLSNRVDELIEVLARRGSLAVIRELVNGALSARAVEVRLRTFAPSVIAQRLLDLRRIGVVEVVPEIGDLRLSPQGRRLQGLLEDLARWADN